MFERFGELESAEEINELAENLLNEGDTESIVVLAEENGIDAEFAHLFIDGEIPALCDPMIAALGKIDVEAKELKPQDIMEDWVEYVKALAGESEAFAIQVRRKGKTLKGMIAELLKWSFSHQRQIEKEILEAAGIKAGRVTLGIPNSYQVKKIIKNYYGV